MNKLCYWIGHSLQETKDHRFFCTYCKDTYYTPRDKFSYTFWESDTWDYLKVVLGFIFVVLLFTLVITLIFVGVNKVACNSYAGMGIPVQFNFWTGCMANHPKFGWIPIDKYFEVLNLYIP